MANNLYTPTGGPAAASFGRSSVPRGEFGLIEAAFEKLQRHYVVFHFPDFNVPEVQYSVALETGFITRVTVIPDENNATAATVITLEVDGVSVVMPALQIAAAGLAGGQVEVIPSGNNQIAVRNSVIKATTDGGGSSVMPGRVIVEITRA